MNAILFSPGLDSWISYKLLSEEGEWEPYYLILDTRYTTKELAAFKRHPLQPALPTVVTNLSLGKIEQQNGFVPQRNPLMITLLQAITGADQIALNAVAGEFSRDKHRKFFSYMSEMLTYTTGKDVKVFSPLLHMTKTQAVAEYLKRGHSADDLLRTVSCYHSESMACGACMSCVRRWVALENNGLTQQWDTDPWRWLRKHHSPTKDLAKLPAAEWGTFARAQRDVVTAWAHLKTRRLRSI